MTTTPISSIRNLGPAVQTACAKADIHSAEELRRLGPDRAYARLIASGTRPHFIGYYAMVMGLQGRPWNDCQGDEKTQLRARFDAIKAASTLSPKSELDQILNRIGVLEPSPKKPT